MDFVSLDQKIGEAGKEKIRNTHLFEAEIFARGCFTLSRVIARPCTTTNPPRPFWSSKVSAP